MTSPGRAVPQDLAARLFRALYDDYDLHTIDELHVAVPSLGEADISGIRGEDPSRRSRGASRTAACMCG
jgi:hypothetical protein